MFTTRTLAALFALTLTASLGEAQTRPPVVKGAANVAKPKVQLPAGVAAGQAGKFQIPDAVKARLNAADLAVTSVQVGADSAVTVTVKNVGRSATSRTVKLFVGTSGTGNLQNLADTQMLDVPVMAAGESRTFVTNKFLVQNARKEVDGAGVILVGANVDKLEQIDEPSEANNVKIISAK